MNDIEVVGAKEHNLKDISVIFNRYKFIVVTGLSGSGKSSLVMDTVYAEGQRRYVESLSPYARQFLGLMEKPNVEHITGLSPAIAIDQKSTSKNPRSTVGTMTEIYDHIRLLYTHLGQPYCPKCSLPITQTSISQIIDKIRISALNSSIADKAMILAPIIRGVKGEHKEVFKKLRKEGYLRVRVNGDIHSLEEKITCDRYKVHHIEVVVDRLKTPFTDEERLADSVETAIKLSQGLVIIHTSTKESLYSENFSCLACGFSFKEISPRLFSFNSPYGACSDCGGLGSRSSSKNQYWLMRRYKKTQSESVKEKIEQEMSSMVCKTCEGKRLNSAALSIKVKDLNIFDITTLSIHEAYSFIKKITLSEQEKKIGDKILQEILGRLSFLINVGLEYLTLDRSASTLSGGEAQRIRLATQIGSGLVNVLYVLDEPSIGLHQRDNERLLETLENLKNKGNTLIIIEHDEDTMTKADQIIDIGPLAGIHGGEVTFSGTYKEILSSKTSLTGQYLSGKKNIPLPDKRRVGNGNFLSVEGAKHNNLKNISVSIPLGCFVSITGVSGSGKSTLVHEIIHKGLMQKIHKSEIKVGNFDKISGYENIDKVILINQSPIGRTPRSNVSTYIGLFSHIRHFFASLPESSARGYQLGRFSFNIKGGRCETCQGAGQLKMEMHFMPDIYVTCEQCKGNRFNPETLQVKYKGHSIADVLALSVEEGLSFFKNIPNIYKPLKTLSDVGLGYISLGQSATTLSGGEAQRIKLSKELTKRSTGKTLYLLDEPTTGLHFDDIKTLLKVLNLLVDKGNTVLVIEHNLDVIKVSDHIVDLGPEGGSEGGHIVARGSPENISKVKKSHTGLYLKRYFKSS